MRTIPWILFWIITLFSTTIRVKWTDGSSLALIGWWEKLITPLTTKNKYLVAGTLISLISTFLLILILKLIGMP